LQIHHCQESDVCRRDDFLARMYFERHKIWCALINHQKNCQNVLFWNPATYNSTTFPGSGVEDKGKKYASIQNMLPAISLL